MQTASIASVLLRAEIAILAGISLGSVWVAAPLRAQDRTNANWDYKVEAFGDYGAVHVMNLIVTNNRNGTGFAGGVGWRPLGAAGHGLGLEVRMARIAYDGVPGGQDGAPGATDYDRWHASLVAADVTYHFWSHSRVQPYLIAGFGYMTTSGTFLCTTCGWNPDPATGKKIYIEDRRTGSGSDQGPLFGGGLKVAVTRHVFFRAEFFQLLTTQGTRMGWESSTIGMGIRF